jgi:hypothetical protein
MPHKKNLMDRIYSLNTKDASVLIFGIAFLTRALLNYIFFERYGYGSVQHIETWFYYGVARGKFQLMFLDPTAPILRAVNAFSGDFLVYGIVFMGIILSSLTAVLLFLLVRELHDNRAGIIAGLLYATLAFSTTMNTAGFTHDIVALPIIVLISYLAVMARKGDSKIRVILMLLLVAVGASINPMVIVAVFAVLVYFVTKKADSYDTFVRNILLITAGAILVRFLFYQDILYYIAELALRYRGIDMLSQIEIVDDLSPPDLNLFKIGYNLLWLLVPFGLISALKKRDGMSLSIFLAGILVASAVSKGWRVMNLGICIIAALGFVNLDKFQRYKPLFLAIFFLSNFMISSNYTTSKFSQTQYEIFEWLEANTEPGETLYAKFTYGFTLQALSNLQAVSTPEQIKPNVYSILWTQDEDVMALGLNLLDARYILVSEEDFYYYEDSKQAQLVIKEAVFPPELFRQGLSESLLPVIKRTMIYRLLYDGDLEHFTLLAEWTDPQTGARYRVYELDQ